MRKEPARRAPKALSYLARIALLLPWLVTASADVAPADGRWQTRLSVAWVDTDLGSSDLGGEDSFLRAEASGEMGFGFSVERRLGDLFGGRLGLELGLVNASPDVESTIRVITPTSDELQTLSDGLNFTPISLGLNVHLLPRSAWDLYGGPRLAYVSYGDLVFPVRIGSTVVGADVSTEDETTWGVGLGVARELGESSWSLHLAADYYDTVLGIDEPGFPPLEFDFDPVVARLGFTYSRSGLP